MGCYGTSMAELPWIHIVLVEPQIPPNTGNIARLAAATAARLHLIEPLGFSLEDRYLKRAGLDYWPSVDLRVHGSRGAYLTDAAPPPERRWLFTARGGRSFREVPWQAGDHLIFGREEDGLPPELKEAHAGQLVSIPQEHGAVRSLNLSNAVAVAVYEAMRGVRGR